MKVLIEETHLRMDTLRLLIIRKRHCTFDKVRRRSLRHTRLHRIKHARSIVQTSDPKLSACKRVSLTDHFFNVVVRDVVRSAKMAAQITIHVEAELARIHQTSNVSVLAIAHAGEHTEHGGFGFLFGFGGFTELFAVAEPEVVGSDVLVERGFGFEGCAAGIFAVPVFEVVVFGVVEGVGSACVASFFVVYSLDVDGEVVLAVEDAGAVWLWARVLWLLCRVCVDSVEVGPKVRIVLEALTAFGALGWVALLDMRNEFFLRCE
jgi:hypothetical protein